MSTEQDAGILAPGSSLGRYTIVRRLAGGSMGQVYEARHTDLDKRVAVKVMARSLGASADLRERFLREGKAAARVRHPHAVDISDVGVDNNRLYLVMEYLEGEDLAALLTREKKLSPERTADLMLPVVAALAAVHEEGIVHRDLKPANLILTFPSDQAPRVKILDFGIATLTSDDPSAGSDRLGTPLYMAPEQLAGDAPITAAVDIWALTLIAFELFVGVPYWEGNTAASLYVRIPDPKARPRP